MNLTTPQAKYSAEHLHESFAVFCRIFEGGAQSRTEPLHSPPNHNKPPHNFSLFTFYPPKKTFYSLPTTFYPIIPQFLYIYLAILRISNKRHKMKTTLFAFVMMAVWPMSMSGALAPSVYAKAQNRSPEVMVIKVGKVTRYRYTRNRVYVKARVRVLRVDRASRRIRPGRWITIRYRTTLYPRRGGAFGAAAIPVLRRGQVYRAFLRRIRYSRYYAPSAGARSFVPLKSRRKVRR